MHIKQTWTEFFQMNQPESYGKWWSGVPYNPGTYQLRQWFIFADILDHSFHQPIWDRKLQRVVSGWIQS